MGATLEVGNNFKGIKAATTSNIESVGRAVQEAGKVTELAGTSALAEILSFADANSALITGSATAAEEQFATLEKNNLAVNETNRITNARQRA